MIQTPIFCRLPGFVKEQGTGHRQLWVPGSTDGFVWISYAFTPVIDASWGLWSFVSESLKAAGDASYQPSITVTDMIRVSRF